MREAQINREALYISAAVTPAQFVHLAYQYPKQATLVYYKGENLTKWDDRFHQVNFGILEVLETAHLNEGLEVWLPFETLEALNEFVAEKMLEKESSYLTGLEGGMMLDAITQELGQRHFEEATFNAGKQMPFGKHKGKGVNLIAKEDPGYMKWLYKTDITSPELRVAIDAAYKLIPEEKLAA